MTASRRIVISADDFGLSAGVNRGIVELLESGAISSTAIILGHPGTAEALAIAKSMPDLDLGLHVNLTDGEAVSSDTRLASLTDASGGFVGRRRVAVAAMTRSVDLDGVRAEVTAQIDDCLSRGLYLTHIDSHHYLHALPGIGGVIRDCAADAGIPLIRATGWRSFVPAMSAGVRTDASPGGSSARSAPDPELPEQRPRPASDYVIPLGAPRGPMPVPVLRRLLRSVSHGVVEIIAHPGYVDAELAARSTYVEGRERELSFLASGRVQDTIAAAGMKRSSFRELAAEAPG